MPIYEYGCEAGHRFEVTQKVSDPPLTTCQVCARPVSKLISAPAISFKGTGWYVTDYSNKLKPPAQEGKAESAPSSPPASSPASPPSSGSARSATSSPTPTGSSGTWSSPATRLLFLLALLDRFAPRLLFALVFCQVR